jgi:hypothetical protein
MSKMNIAVVTLLLVLGVAHAQASPLPKQPAKVLAKKGTFLNSYTRTSIQERRGYLIRQEGGKCEVNVASIPNGQRRELRHNSKSNIDLKVSGDLTVICL